MTTDVGKVAQNCNQLIKTFLATEATDYPQKFTANLLPSWSVGLHQSVQSQVSDSFTDLVTVINKYTLDHLSLSYNGGKDCLVLLVIYMAAIYEVYGDLLNKSIKAVYIHTEPAFMEQIEFLEQSVLQFGLDFTSVYTYPSSPGSTIQNSTHVIEDIEHFELSPQPFKFEGNLERTDSSASITKLYSKTHSLPSGFQTYLDSDPQVKAIVAGIRRTDPYSQFLTLEQETDVAKGWPLFIRINPVLEWNTAQVWTFVRWLKLSTTRDANNEFQDLPFELPLTQGFHISYCSLYDQGYTSLGGRHNTVKNPNLKRGDNEEYLPAWKVVDDDIERLGRNQKGKV